jgi:hypothetical protein
MQLRTGSQGLGKGRELIDVFCVSQGGGMVRASSLTCMLHWSTVSNEYIYNRQQEVIKNENVGHILWYTPVIPATWEEEIRRIKA